MSQYSTLAQPSSQQVHADPRTSSIQKRKTSSGTVQSKSLSAPTMYLPETLIE
jgi:hypothetical protein